jgi:hypothetical protein
MNKLPGFLKDYYNTSIGKNFPMNHGLWVACLSLFVLAACNAQQRGGTGNSENAPKIQLTIGEVAIDDLLFIRHQGSNQSWDSDTLAIISWWDKQGDEHTHTVSVINDWSAEQQPIERGYLLNCSHKQLGLSFNIELVTSDSILTTNIPSNSIKETGEARLKTIRPLPYFGAASEGEEGYMAIPKGVGALCYFRGKEPREYQLPVYSFSGANMPIFGLIRGTGGFAGIITSGQFNAQFNISTNWGAKHKYSIAPEFILRPFKEDKLLAEDLRTEYHFLPGDQVNWAGIGRCYRQYNFSHRGVVPLKERVKQSPELTYASQAMEVRLRLGVKPVPYKIVEQTPENEPPVRVFLTFKKVRDIINEFHEQGIKETEFCLVGWNTGGHDGRYPQIFPVESSLGGEEELRKTIKHGQSLGYQMAAHNCYMDAYRISEDWDEEYIRKKADGQLWKGSQWGGGMSYGMCLARAYDLFAKRDLPKIRELGFNGLHYTDVLTIVEPHPCYDPSHPQTLRQDVESRNRILELCSKTFGGVQSEGSLDFAAHIQGRFLYLDVMFGNTGIMQKSYIDINIPLYASVYHGVVTYNLNSKTFNSLPEETEYLQNIEYGGVPMAYFYAQFIIEGSGRSNWIGNRDYRYDSQKGLKQAVVGLKQVYSDFQNLKHLQLEFVEGHNQLAKGVFETVYSNGESVVVNYNGSPFQFVSGETVPARGFKLTRIKR